jgi:acetylornithine aminotransferase
LDQYHSIFSGFRKICSYDVVLILDEVQSGYGRSGKFFAHNIIYQSRYNLFGKGMGNGFPIGGIMISPKFTASYGLWNYFWRKPSSVCAGIAVLDVMEKQQLMDNVRCLRLFSGSNQTNP